MHLNYSKNGINDKVVQVVEENQFVIKKKKCLTGVTSFMHLDLTKRKKKMDPLGTDLNHVMPISHYGLR